jgi:hypothetical protein
MARPLAASARPLAARAAGFSAESPARPRTCRASSIPDKVSIRSRILKVGAAKSLEMVIVTVVRFFSVPLFLHAWSTELYGEWLILYSLPACVGRWVAGMRVMTVHT